MFDGVLNRMREKVRTLDYIMSVHADEEREADELTMLDVEHCILAGQIIERQRNKINRELKYKISGTTMSGHEMEVIAKIGLTSKLVIITVYSC